MAAWQETAYPAEAAERYRVLYKQMEALMDGERDPVANMANMSALLFQGLEGLNWAGFYLLKQGMLVLGPFQGKPACIRIPLGRGVCGTAAQQRETLRIEDVHAFPGHIACDGASQSEIVVPLLAGDRLLGVLDVDSPHKGRFAPQDQAGLEAMAALLANGCDWDA